MDKIESPIELGIQVRMKRKKDGLTQMEAAALCDVGTRFISDLENGKPTLELGKTIQVLRGLGLDILVMTRGMSDKVRKQWQS